MSLLNENLNIKGIIFTPNYLADAMASILTIFEPESVIDICAGCGVLLNSVHKINPNIQLNGIELEHELVNISDNKLNIVQGDSLEYGFYESYDAAILNPPYTKTYKGMEFVQKSLSLLKYGKACIAIVPISTANGSEINKEILIEHRLICSIKMPADLFMPTASVATVIYLFQSSTPHNFEKNKVKFIDFSNDGYKRKKRKTKPLQEVNNPSLRYKLLPELVRGNKEIINHEIWENSEIYIEKLISQNCNDWNIDKHRKYDTKPTEKDFRTVVWNYMEWEYKQQFDDLKEKFINGK
jgi:predicted RNA methylase